MLKQLSLTLLLASTAVQAQRVTTLDWSFGAGPSTATPSGRRSRVASNDPCFSCKKTDQLVTGADEGKFNAALRATGQPSNWGIAFQMEGLFNHAVSLPAAAPAPTCTRYSCEQRRQALVDDAWLLGAGVEFAPFDAKRISPYVVVTGGLSLNRLTWSQDSTNTRDESGHSVQVGPYGGRRNPRPDQPVDLGVRRRTLLRDAGHFRVNDDAAGDRGGFADPVRRRH